MSQSAAELSPPLHVGGHTLPVPFAIGATADIYVWNESWVLKLFHASRPRSQMEHEARVAQAVHDAVAKQSVFRVPSVGSPVEVNGRYGLLYERINGLSMLEQLQAGYDDTKAMEAFACQLAGLHVALHTQVPSPLLPSQQDQVSNALEHAPTLSPVLRCAVSQRFAELSNGVPQMCHGDLHPANVLLPPGNAPVIIDWCDATAGNPLADAARTLLLLQVGQPPDGDPLPSELAIKRDRFSRAYLEHYCRLRLVSPAAVEAWLPVVAAARLNENVGSDEQEQLLAIIRTAYPEAG